jgi:hypothetical protein
MMLTGRDVCRLYDQMKGDRSTLDSHLQDVAEIFKPMRADLLRQTARTMGEKRMTRVFDSAQIYAADQLAAGLWSGATSSADRWFQLAHPDPELDQLYPVRAWMGEVESRKAAVFASGGNRFYSQVLDYFGDLVVMGTAIMYVDEDVAGRRVHFDTRPIHECWIAENNRRVVDTLVRRFEWTAAQIFQEYKTDTPDVVMRSIRAGQEQQRFSILHAVLPNEVYQPNMLGPRGKRFVSMHVLAEGEKVMRTGGFEEFPYMVTRWGTLSGFAYGDSPAMMALPDAKQLQVQERTLAQAAERAAAPPLLAADEDAFSTVRIVPNGITYGGIDGQGRELIKPLASGASFQLDIAMSEQKRAQIKDAFFGSLLMMMPTPGATATEVIARQEEKVRLLGPHLGRVQSELLDPLIARIFRIMQRANALPPLPPELADDPRFAVTYVSPLARAQRSSRAGSVVRGVQQVLTLAQADPTVLDVVDMDEVVRTIFDAEGAPAEVLRDPRDVAKIRADRQQAQQGAAMSADAPGQAKAMLDMAKAQQVAEGLAA